jgi:hypothetical protein
MKALIPMLTLVALLAVPATAQVNYAISGSTAYVANSPNASGDIVIASTYNGYPVTRIFGNAFLNSTNLTSVTIPTSVTNIGVQAFLGCTSLTSVTIPNSVTIIGLYAFRGCTGLTNIAVAMDNPSYSSPDGVLFNKAQTILIQFPCGRDGGYAVPSGVTTIWPFAFYHCTGLTNVTIPNTVVSIGSEAFSGCSGLTGATIPDSVTTIQGLAFYGTALTSVTIPNSVTNLQYGAFALCTSLTNITVAAANPAYSSLNGVLFNKAQTTLFQFPGGRGGGYVIPNGVTGFGSAFSACPNLTSVTIPNTVFSIEPRAFYACYSLTSVTMGSSVTWIRDEAFAGCTNLTSAAIPNSVTIIGGDAFNGCHSLTNVTIPNSVASIGTWAFSSCISLTNVTIGNGVTNIGDHAFYYCTSLLNITVDAANSVYSSVNGVLFNKAQTTLIQFPGGRGGTYVIPSSSVGIGQYAFHACSLTSVTIPASVTGIGAYPFYGCASLTNITVDAANSVCSSVNGVLFDKAQTTLIQFPPGLGGNYLIPGSVTSIGFLAFYGCASLTSITIPDSVTYLDHSAFYYCRSLTNLTFLGNAPALNGTVFYGLAVGARGYYYYGASGWGPTLGGLPTVMLGAPAAQIGTGSTGVNPGGYGFTISGVINQTIVVEASTNLVNWQPIWTNTLSDAVTNFVDPQGLNYPRRFYRLKSN